MKPKHKESHIKNLEHLKKSWIVLSDIHGNAAALFHVMKQIDILYRENKNIQIVSNGDLLGPHPGGKEVLEIMQNKDILWIKGNHELYLEKALQQNHLQNIERHWRNPLWICDFVGHQSCQYYLSQCKEHIKTHHIDFLHGMGEDLREMPSHFDFRKFRSQIPYDESIEIYQNHLEVMGHCHVFGIAHNEQENRTTVSAGSVGSSFYHQPTPTPLFASFLVIDEYESSQGAPSFVLHKKWVPYPASSLAKLYIDTDIIEICGSFSVLTMLDTFKAQPHHSPLLKFLASEQYKGDDWTDESIGYFLKKTKATDHILAAIEDISIQKKLAKHLLPWKP